MFFLTDLPSEEKCTIELNAAKETGYSGDLDTSSSDASQPQSSESEDDYAVISRKGNIHFVAIAVATTCPLN